MLMRDALLVSFLIGQATGMTEMTEITKKMESRTLEEWPEVYRPVAYQIFYCLQLYCKFFGESWPWSHD